MKDVFDNSIYYEKEFIKIQKYLKSSYNQVNEKSLEVFLKGFPTIKK